MDRFDPFVKYADVYGDIINWEKDPMNKPQNQNKYFFSDGKTYYEQICKMLRLMSVFKEAFNQIYSNEDEISEAWENFVNNLSASVVEGSEPDVTLTWTDDSVNFEFTMVPGVPGEQGVGITSISFNSDYTMTIALSDGNTYTSMSLKGETGPQGPQGETGSGLQILDVYATLADLQSAHPTGQPGDAYQVGSGGSYTLYIWSSSQSAWVPAGSLGTVSPSVSNPLMDGTASAGSLNQYSRGDHVHPSDTSRASKEELDALIKTSQALIDQSFTCRESPAIQDGLARIDKIKGNTLSFNQLLPVNWASSGNGNGVTFTNNNDGSYTFNGTSTGTTFIPRSVTISAKANHKYFVNSGNDSNTGLNITINGLGEEFYVKTKAIISSSVDANFTMFYQSGASFNNLKVWPQVIDLTQMFGTGNEPSTVEEFTSLFPQRFYPYQSTLLPFKGTSIKTVGKNLLTYSVSALTTNGITFTPQNDGSVKVSGTATGNAYYNFYNWANNTIFPLNQSLRLSGGTSQVRFTVAYRNTDGSGIVEAHDTGNGATITIPSADKVIYVALRVLQGTTIDTVIYPMVTFANAEQTFEPYKETITNLPTLTYFPNGMKSAGNVYDELTESKAITRVGAVDLGSLTWTKSTNYNTVRFITDNNVVPLAKLPLNNTEVANIKSKYNPFPTNDLINTTNEGIALSSTGVISIRDNTYTSGTAEAFKNALQGVYLYYELATPTGTDIDIDLSFKSYLDGTEQLLPVNASVPSTSPIIADMTYLSIDDAMEYILDKLANVPQNTQQILESLEDDVTDLQTDVGALQPVVSSLQTSVSNINTNIGQLSSTVAGHTASISDIQSDITDLNTDLSDLGDTVTDNTSRISTLETDLASTDGQVQSIGSSVSTLSSTVSDQGIELGEIDSIIQDISNNPVISALGTHELGFVAAYVDATLPANTGTRVTIPKPTIFPNNYTPLFIVGMSTGAYNVSICEIPPTFGNSDSVNCRVWNHGSQQTTQITVYILCMRQRQSQ